MWSAGNNTVEFGSNGTLTIAQGGKVQAPVSYTPLDVYKRQA